MATHISHANAFKAQSEFSVEAKIKIGQDIWSPETAGSRLYAEVLSKKPSTVGKALDLAAKLDPPFTAKQTMGHLRSIFTAGQLAVDGKSYVVQAKPKAKADPKPAKVAKVEKPAKAKAKAEPQVAASRKRGFVKTKKLAKAA
jgi:hypothetical protein